MNLIAIKKKHIYLYIKKCFTEKNKNRSVAKEKLKK